MRVILASLALFAIAGCSTEPPLVEGPARPMLWTLYDEDTRIVIMGSVHQLPPDVDWLRGRVAMEAAGADELLLELSPDEQAKAAELFAAMSDDEPVPDLASRFGTDAAERIADAVLGASIEREDADALESWAIAILIGQLSSRDSGLAGEHGVETRLIELFRRDDRRINGLETAAGQLAMFDALSLAAQNRMAIAASDARGEARTRARTMVSAWARGDKAALERIVAETISETPDIAEPVIHARNRAWAVQVAQRLEQPGDVMLVVGAGHLVGPGSLIEELARRDLRAMRLR